MSWKTYLLRDFSVRRLYRQRLDVYDGFYGVSDEVQTEWGNMKVIVEGAAVKVLGKSRKRKREKTIMWTQDLKEAVERKNGLIDFS